MAFIAEAFFSGCISKVINDGKDYSWDKIKNVINDRKNQNLSTKIYRVIEKTLNIVTSRKFKDTDILYQATETIFIEFKNNGNILESVKAGLGMLVSNVNNIDCEYFLTKFYERICKDDGLCKAISLMLQKKGVEISQYGFRQLNNTIKKNHEEIMAKIEDSNGNSKNTEERNADNTEFHNNKKQDYIDNWNGRMFLHIDNNENPLTLADAFIMPDLDIHKYNSKIGFFNEYENDLLCPSIGFEEAIAHFIRYDKTSTMLITGAPGIGKTTIVSWFAAKYEKNNNIIILRFRDWDTEDLEKGLLKAVCTTLKCKKNELNNKILILDGFDEMKLLSIRGSLLNGFFNEILDLKNIKCIITSRPHYISSESFQNVLELLSFDIYKIKQFYQKITSYKENIEFDFLDYEYLNIIGVPVILYMAIMSNLDITKRATKEELYNCIFREKGGIFDRFAYEGIAYSEGTHILRNPENIKTYLEFLQKVAFIMFEKNSLLATIEDCEVPTLEFQGDLVSILEFPIKHLFEKTGFNLEFIHKSIYEYFVSEYIIIQMCKAIETNVSKKKFAGLLGRLFKRKYLSKDILDFLKYKVENSILKHKFNFINEVFQLMLKEGMTYYTNKRYKNVNQCEMMIFVNMLDFVHLWEDCRMKFNNSLCLYLKLSTECELNLSWANLSKVNLKGLNLVGANLKNSILVGVDLSQSDLTGSFLEGANLSEADLTRTDLSGVDLSETIMKDSILNDTIIDEIQIDCLEQQNDLKNIKVYLNESHDIVSYKEYQNRRK